MGTTRKRLGHVLVERGLLTVEQLEEAEAVQRSRPEPLGHILVRQGHISEERLLQVMASQTGVTPWLLQSSPPAKEALDLVDPEICRQYQVLPVQKRADLLIVAMRNPDDTEAIELLRNHTNLRIEPVLAEEKRLASYIDSALMGRDAAGVGAMDALVKTALDDASDSAPRIRRTQHAIMSEEDTRPVVGLVNQMLSDAIRMESTDIHVEPRERRADVRYRLDGRLIQVREIPNEVLPMLTARIKIMAELDIVEHRLPQDGRMTVHIDGRSVDIRVSVLPNYHGQRIVLRILDSKIGLKDVDSIGFSRHNATLFRNLIQQPYGMFLVTGPTGSGKTTTLYAALNELKDEGTNVMTCEDPVEYDIEGINQSQVDTRVGLTFARQLRGILRQDPDVILVGEIRDAETAQTAVRAALTGHMVMSTLHCNDSSSAVARMLDLEVDRHLLAGSLIGTMAQRLLRKLCPHCREEYQPGARERSLIDHYCPKAQLGVLYRPRECGKCYGTGYRGRFAVHEIMPVTTEVSKLIDSGAASEDVRAESAYYGFRSMQEDALMHVVEGVTSFDEAQRAIAFESLSRASDRRRLAA